MVFRRNDRYLQHLLIVFSFQKTDLIRERYERAAEVWESQASETNVSWKFSSQRDLIKMKMKRWKGKEEKKMGGSKGDKDEGEIMREDISPV